MDTMGIYTISLARGLDIPKVKRFKLEDEWKKYLLKIIIPMYRSRALR